MRRAQIFPLVAAAAAFALYFAHSGRSFAYDEAHSVGVFVRPGDLWLPFHTQAVFNNHPLFSFVLVVVGRLTSTDEHWMRLFPALCGAGAVAVFAWWAHRRFRTSAAVAGTLYLATCPLFLGEVRQARGYALVALCAVVASVVLVDEIEGAAGCAAYIAAIAIGVGTHLYMLLVVLAHAGYALARPERRRKRLLDLAVGTALGSLVYIGLWRAMRDGARERGHHYHPEFANDLTRELLGHSIVSIVLFGALLAIAARTLLRRRDVAAALFPPMFVVLVAWQIAKPTDLYPRFLIAAAFPVAAGITWVVHRYRTLLPVAFVAVIATFVPQIHALGREPPIRTAAEYVYATRALGRTPCAIGASPLSAYVTEPPRFVAPDQIASCDVVVRTGSFGHDTMKGLRTRYPYYWRYLGKEIVSRIPRSTLEHAAASAHL